MQLFDIFYGVGSLFDQNMDLIYKSFIFLVLGGCVFVYLAIGKKEMRFPGLEDSKKNTGWIHDYNPFSDDPGYKNRGKTQYYPAAAPKPTENKIKYQFQSKISNQDRATLNDLQSKKDNLIKMKEKYLEFGSIEDYNFKLLEFDVRTKKINDEAFINSQVYSVLNPVIDTLATPGQLPRVVVSEQEYKAYIHSKLWRRRSLEFRKSKEGRCDVCHQIVGLSGLSTHHTSYPSDLIVGDSSKFWLASCRPCHHKQEADKRPLNNMKSATITNKNMQLN